MNYQTIYNILIERCKQRKNLPEVYVELHHIIPQSIGGTNDKTNLVELTLREHYFAHELLVRIYPECNQLKYALWMMTITTISALHNDGSYRCIRLNDLSTYDKQISISCNQYEYAKQQYINGKLTKTYSTQERKNVSNGTIKGMKSKNTILNCAKGSKGTKWYYNKETGKSYKWHIGDKDIDLTIYSWGRGKNSSESNKRVSIGHQYPKKWYKLKDTELVTMFPDDAIIPGSLDNWIILSKKNNQMMKKCYIENLLYPIIKNFNFKTNFKYDRCICIYQNKRLGLHKNRICPAVYELLRLHGILSKEKFLNTNNIEDILIKNIDKIIKLNKTQLTFKEL